VDASDPDGELGSAASLLRALSDAPGGRPLHAGQVVAGKYTVAEAIGEGGMGVVYRAHDATLGRDVALKVGSRLSPNALARAQREAQALARLSHPNVVVVHEIGEVEGRVFVAMELITGGTARDWLRERPRSRAEIVALYAAAGDGLAAAHAAGIVHRDFKPDNVLVGVDGRPRVADFGLARTAKHASADDDPPGTSPLAEVTQTGAVVGTRAYMAPEQLAGADVDARADQYAFAAALWEGLAGARRDEPGARALSRRDRAVLARALADDPVARWPSLAALVTALRRPRRRRLEVAALALAVAVSAVAIAAVATRDDAGSRCGDDAAALAPIWSPTRSAAIASALGSAGGAAWRGLAPHLDRYAADWTAAHHAACVATRVDGAQSDAMLDRRMLCLHTASAQLDAILARLSEGGHAAIENAPDALALLPDLSACADVDALAREPLPPADAVMRAQIATVTEQIVQVRTAALWGVKNGATAADPLVAAAEATGWPPLIADARHARAALLEDAERVDDARAELEGVAQYALQHDVDRLAARAMIDLGQSYADADRVTDARHWIDLARALWSRLGEPDALGSLVFTAQASVDFNTGNTAAALADTLRATDARRRFQGEDAADHFNLANVYDRLGRGDEAAAENATGRALVEREYGSDHPINVMYLTQAAEIEVTRVRYPAAVAMARRAVAVAEAWYGPDDIHLAKPLRTLGTGLARTGDIAGARATDDRLIAILGHSSPDPTRMDYVLYDRAYLAIRSGDFRAAAGDCAQVLAHFEARVGDNSPQLIPLLELLGVADRHLGKLDESAQLLGRALALEIATSGAGGPLAINETAELSYTRLAQGRTAEAAALVATALPLLEAGTDIPAMTAAEFHQAYADATWRAGGDRAKARAHAVLARDGYAALGADYAEQRAASEAWLASHR
jgi:tetratricopeptide (TPR) repeat protein